MTNQCCCYPCLRPCYPPCCTVCYIPYVFCCNSCCPARVTCPPPKKEPKLTDFIGTGAPGGDDSKAKKVKTPKDVKEKEKVTKKESTKKPSETKVKASGSKRPDKKESIVKSESPSKKIKDTKVKKEEKEKPRKKNDAVKKGGGEGMAVKGVTDETDTGGGVSQEEEEEGEEPVNKNGEGDGAPKKKICKCNKPQAQPYFCKCKSRLQGTPAFPQFQICGRQPQTAIPHVCTGRMSPYVQPPSIRDIIRHSVSKSQAPPMFLYLQNKEKQQRIGIDIGKDKRYTNGSLPPTKDSLTSRGVLCQNCSKLRDIPLQSRGKSSRNSQRPSVDIIRPAIKCIHTQQNQQNSCLESPGITQKTDSTFGTAKNSQRPIVKISRNSPRCIHTQQQQQQQNSSLQPPRTPKQSDGTFRISKISQRSSVENSRNAPRCIHTQQQNSCVQPSRTPLKSDGTFGESRNLQRPSVEMSRSAPRCIHAQQQNFCIQPNVAHQYNDGTFGASNILQRSNAEMPRTAPSRRCRAQYNQQNSCLQQPRTPQTSDGTFGIYRNSQRSSVETPRAAPRCIHTQPHQLNSYLQPRRMFQKNSGQFEERCSTCGSIKVKPNIPVQPKCQRCIFKGSFSLT